jgi:hypothetical protein
VLAREVGQLPPTEFLDLLDRRRHDERLVGLLWGAAVCVFEDTKRSPPCVRAALVEVLVQDTKCLRNKLIESGATGLFEGRLPGSAARSA